MKRFVWLGLAMMCGCGGLQDWLGWGDRETAESQPETRIEFAPTPATECGEGCGSAPNGAPAARITSFKLVGTETDPVCCVDLNGDGVPENSMGLNLAAYGHLDSSNACVAEHLAAAGDTWALEFAEGQARWWRGEVASTDVVVVDSPRPELGLSGVVVTDRGISASGGLVELPIAIFDDIMVVPAHVTGFELTSREGTDVDARVLDGELGVVFEVREWLAGVNRILESCTCLGSGAPMLDTTTGACREDLNMDACQAVGDERCVELAGACNLYGAAGLFADVDLNGDGLNDGVSAGYEIETQPVDLVTVSGL